MTERIQRPRRDRDLEAFGTRHGSAAYIREAEVDEWITAQELCKRLGIGRKTAWRRLEVLGGRPGDGTRWRPPTFPWPRARELWAEWCRTVQGGPRARLTYEPSDTALWALRTVPLGRLCAAFDGVDRHVFSENLARRGFRWGEGARRRHVGKNVGGLLLAPCINCGTSTGVDELNTLRECLECRGVILE